MIPRQRDQVQAGRGCGLDYLFADTSGPPGFETIAATSDTDQLHYQHLRRARGRATIRLTRGGC